MEYVLKAFGDIRLEIIIIFIVALIFIIKSGKKAVKKIIDINGAVDALRKSLDEVEKMAEVLSYVEEGTKGMLRFKINKYCMEIIERGFVIPIELDELNGIYKPYIDLGGNGQTKKMYEEVLKLPIRKE